MRILGFPITKQFGNFRGTLADGTQPFSQYNIWGLAYCYDKDCLTDLQVFFTDRAQPVIDNAMSVKCKDVEIITVYLDVEPVPFNKGFYSVDITFFFKVTLSAYNSPVVPPATVVGVAAFSKKVILFGSDGNVKVYCSTDPRNCSEHDNTNMPKASVHTADPKQGYEKAGETTDR